MDTNRLLSRHFGGDSAHLAPQSLLAFRFEEESNKEEKVEGTKGLLLTCAAELRVAIPIYH